MNPNIRKTTQSGFTLVEVIVVAVIVAAMAAVAVPLYLNYVQSARTNAASNAAGAVASFCGACANSGGAVLDATVPAGGGKLTCNVGTSEIQVPTDIIIGHTPPAAGPPRVPGTVTGKHVTTPGAGVDATFRY